MQFVKESVIHTTPERLFAFHEQPGVLTLLIPPWESAKVIEPARISEVGSRAIIETKILGPISVRWIAEHTVYDPPTRFEDVQVKGPFRAWRHQHIVQPADGGALLRDQIDWDPPFGFLGGLMAPLLVERRLQRLFDYRHEVTRKWCEPTGKDEG